MIRFLPVLMLSAACLATASWTPQVTGLVSKDLRFITTGWRVVVAGDSGTILSSSSSGSAWDLNFTGTSANLSSVQYVTSDIGWAVGDRGTILITTNHNAPNWTAQNSGTARNLKSVCFHGRTVSTGLVAGDSGTILKTTDAGVTWTAQTSGKNVALLAVKCLNDNTAWIVGEQGTILKTTNGGATWTPLNSGTSKPFNFVDFVDSNNVWAIGEGVIRRTTDGGATWMEAEAGISEAAPVWSGFFDNITAGWAISTESSVYKTTDGGITWTSATGRLSNSKLLSAARLRGAEPPGILFAVGMAGALLRSSDGGSQWAPVLGSPYALKGISIAGNFGWAVGDNGYALKKYPAGQWAAITTGIPNHLRSVHFPDTNTGWAVGQSDSMQGGAILKSTDGGWTWARQTSGNPNTLNAVHFVNAGEGWAVGDNGTVLKAPSTGSAWTPQSSGTTSNLASIHFAPGSANAGWAVGAGGTLIRTTNGGLNWLSESTGTLRNLKSVFFLDTTTGWIAGDSGTILKTTTGGATWVPQAGGTTRNLNAVYFLTADSGRAVGDRGTILKTGNGGATWAMESNGTTENLYALELRPGLRWICGAEGLVLGDADPVGISRRGTKGASGSGFGLSQTDIRNVTDIRFQLALSAPHVSLILRDAKGGTVATLVNGPLEAGMHSVRFDASRLRAGIYFASLRAGNNVDVKRMVRLK